MRIVKVSCNLHAKKKLRDFSVRIFNTNVGIFRKFAALKNELCQEESPLQ